MRPYFTAIKCEVGKGQVKTQYAVRFQDYQGSWVSLFADTNWVQHDDYHITADNDHDGLLTVCVVHEREGLYIVRLPGESFEQGRYVTVKKHQLLQAE